MQLTSVLLSWQTLILSAIIAYRLLRGVTVLYSKARQIIFSSLLLFIVSCNSNTTYDKKVLNDLNKYELSAKELVEHFDSLAPINNSRDTNFHSFILYSNQIIEGENEIYKKHFPLPQTRKLCLDNPPAFIFVNSDTSVYFNTWNSESTIFKTFAHFVCFVPKDQETRFDFLTHAYKIVKSQKLRQNWTYVIIEEGFD